MRHLLAVLSILLNISGFASEEKRDWIDHYVLAEQAVNRKDGSTAIEEFSKAIELSPEKIFLYLQRGQIFEKKHQWENAIQDFTSVIENPNTHVSLLLPALYSRAQCYLRLDGMDNYLADRTGSTRFEKDYKLAQSLDTSLMHTEKNENYSIEFNIPEGDLHHLEYRKQYAEMMVEIDFCDSEEDVMFFDNGVVITKLKKKELRNQKGINIDRLVNLTLSRPKRD